MISRKKNFSKDIRQFNKVLFYTFIELTLACFFPAYSGVYNNTNFPVINDGIQDSGLTYLSGLRLGVNRNVGIKILGDSLQPALPNTIYSDVISSKSDTFSFFYVQENSTDGVYRRDVRITGGFYTYLASAEKICDLQTPSDCYLHADKGETGYLLSLVRNGAGQHRVLHLANGFAQMGIDSSIQKEWLFSSQCHMKGDTFCIVYSNEMASVHLKKVYAKGNVIEVISDAVVSTDTTSGNKLMNCSVACDGKGGVLVAWARGTPIGNKKVHFRFYNQSLDPGPGDSINQQLGDNKFYYYDDVAITVLDSLKFAMVHWDNTGLWLNKIENQNNVVSKISEKIINRPGLQHSTIASNRKYCIVACIGDADGDGYAGLEGLRYDVTNGNLQNPMQYNFSRKVNIVPVDLFSTSVNAVLDTGGDFALTWRYQKRIQGSIFANRAVMNSSGFWISPVESLSIATDDSVRFHPANVITSSLTSWNMANTIRTGSTKQACAEVSWISLSDDQMLNSIMSTNRYFQYRLKINRIDGGDSLSTPLITSISIPWNAKPVILGMDSIKIRDMAYQSFGTGNSVNVYSRVDSLRVRLRLRDSDPLDTLYVKGTWPAENVILKLPSSTLVDTTLLFLPSLSDTSVQCTISVWDYRNWYATPKIFTYTSRNATPQLTTVLSYNNSNGERINRSIASVDTILIHETDSLEIIYSVADSNDQGRVSAYVFNNFQGILTTLDSMKDIGQRKLIIRGDTAEPSHSSNIVLTVSDPDTSINCNLLFSVNHSPQLDSVYVKEKLILMNDTASVIIGGVAKVEIVAHDVDCAFGDILKYHFRTVNDNDSIISTNQKVEYNWIPQRDDSSMLVIISDRHGKSDSIRFYIKFPWFETDKSVNSSYATALDTLNNGVSLIIGSQYKDTVFLPILNSGKDLLKISSIKCNKFQKRWLKVGVPYDTGLYIVDFIDSCFNDTLSIKGLEQKLLVIYFSTGTFAGDNIIFDTLTLTTNDSIHACVKIPVSMEYNDLPRIVSISPDFVPDIPWRLDKKLSNQYLFPPHASICVLFSEPVESTSVKNGLHIYSVKDSSITGKHDYLNVKHKWSQNYTRLNCNTPVYHTASPAFRIKPPEGLFIPTDIIAVKLTREIIDKATTPNGPNNLDINCDYSRNNQSLDTIIRMKVDSIGFSVLDILPALNDTQIAQKPKIILTFSSSVYASSVDMMLQGNRSLIVRSKYNNGEQLHFDSVIINENRVKFHIAKKLFFCDSLWCRYNSSTIKNNMGFPSDNNKNGIPITMYDTTDSSDDIFWSYRVKNIQIVSTVPVNKSVIKQISPSIIITFSDSIDKSVFDTDTSNFNKSVKIRSKFSSELTSFESIDFLDGGKSVRIQPKRKFFSNDSIWCRFVGFTKSHNYSAQINIPIDTINNFTGYNWSFNTGNTGFYTYPNPYKPGSNRRHCIDNGPCGIWFKNLHILKEGVYDVEITIFSMNTNPVYNSKKAGQIIHFENNSAEYLPEWLWDTRNQKGDLVASGLYFYIIKDTGGNTLLKGKLMIVR